MISEADSVQGITLAGHVDSPQVVHFIMVV